MEVISGEVLSEEKEDLTDYYINNLTWRNCVEIVENYRRGWFFTSLFLEILLGCVN